MNADITRKIRELSYRYADTLEQKVSERTQQMISDDKSHYLLYRVLGISQEEGEAIDLYQNKGRFLYRYAGALLEQATMLCFETKFPEAKSIKILNPDGQKPKFFGIDCLVENAAYEIKWRDATTDGDHILKEHRRIRAIAAAGYVPIRLMYFAPNREQAIRIQTALADLYKANHGFYYSGPAAWQHLEEKTGVNLYAVLQKIVEERDQ